MVAKVMGKMGAPIKACAMIYKAVVQAVLLYGSPIWVVTDAMVMVIEVFQHMIARQILGVTARKGDSGKLERTLVGAKLDTTGICMVREYMRRWQVKISEYGAGRPIYKLCTGE